MNTQSEALRLADYLVACPHLAGVVAYEAAAELRRLFELAHEQHTEIYGLRAELRRLHEVNAELLGALNEIASAGVGSIAPGYAEIARTAIAKTTGGQA